MLTRATTIDRVVAAALEGTRPAGDLTSEYLITETATARPTSSPREAGVFSGGEVFAAAFRLTDPRVDVELIVEDGEWFEPGAVLAVVSGPARAVLTAERIGLNFVQRMAGVATLTGRYVAEVAPHRRRVSSTPARPRRVCGRSSATPCATAAATTTATHCRTPSWPRTITSRS